MSFITNLNLYINNIDTNLFIKLDPSEMVLAEEFNQEPTSQEPTVNQPMMKFTINQCKIINDPNEKRNFQIG